MPETTKYVLVKRKITKTKTYSYLDEDGNEIPLSDEKLKMHESDKHTKKLLIMPSIVEEKRESSSSEGEWGI